MLKEIMDLGYDVVPFIENQILVIGKGIEVFVDAENKTFSGRDPKYNGHAKVHDDVLEILRKNEFRATIMHRNITGQG